MADIVNVVSKPLRARFNKNKPHPTRGLVGESKSCTLPWDSWELDADFFRALSQWTLDNPSTNLDVIVKNIRGAIQHGNHYSNLIPDSPFPARSLLQAVFCLVQLGATISTAGREVQEFAINIIEWVGDVKSSFDSARRGEFTRTTWKNLKKMRDLIDEICKWARSRLDDRRWSLKNAIVTSEINEFKSRISEARSIFLDRSLINIAGGIDAILEILRALVRRQDAIAISLQRIQEAQARHANNIIERLDAWEEDNAQQEFLKRTLVPHTVSDPTYDQQGKQPCDDDTRVETLQEIRTWMNDFSESSQNFLWLTGDPGCGKSAITASIARECKDNNAVWAQFFINRNAKSTTNPRSFFPSIARQLSDHSKAAQRQVHDALKQKPSLLDDISPDQAASLFIDAIAAASRVDRTVPVVVIIDGFDETDRNRLEDAARIFSQLFEKLPTYRNAKVFISSRTEEEIRKPFAETIKDSSSVKHMHLDTESSISDVSRFLTRRVRDIATRNELDPDIWPGDARLNDLANQASGLFIWAVTAVRFLHARLEKKGKECLGDVLDKLNAKGMKGITALYSTILEITYNDGEDDDDDNDDDGWTFETFRRIVGTIIIIQEPLCLGDLDPLLSLQRDLHSNPVDIKRFISRLRTVCVAGVGEVNHTTIPRLHKSFVEYITGDQVDKRFRVDQELANREISVQCLRNLSDSYSVIHTARTPSADNVLSGHLRYAVRFCTSHLFQAGTVPFGAIIDTSSLDLLGLQAFLKHSADEHGAGPLILNTSKDKSQVCASLANYSTSWDLLSGQFAAPALTLRGHNNAVSSVAFSPDGRLIASGAWDNTLHLWDAETLQSIGKPLIGHTGVVNAVSFSPKGNHVASGSEDMTIWIWDTASGTPIGSPLRGHSDFVTSVTFSSDGKYIASGSRDKTVRLWDAQEYLPLRGLTGHSDWVRSVRFTPTGSQIISSSDDKTIRRWDLSTGQPIQPSLEGHTSDILSVDISTDSKYIVSGAADRTIRLWSALNGQLIGQPWKGHSGAVNSVCFSPSGRHVLSGSSDMTIQLWDTLTGEALGAPFRGHSKEVLSVSFATNGRQIASGARDATLCIWDIPYPLEATFEVRWSAFSPSGKIIFSACHDGVPRLWNINTSKVLGIPLTGIAAHIHSVAFSLDESYIAGASEEGTIYVWKTDSCQLIAHSPPNLIKTGASIFFVSDGGDIAIICTDGSPSFWSVSNSKLVQSTQPHHLTPEQCNTTYVGVGVQHPQAHPKTILHNRRVASIQWYKTNGKDGFWAYINHRIIYIGGPDMPIVIAPANH